MPNTPGISTPSSCAICAERERRTAAAARARARTPPESRRISARGARLAATGRARGRERDGTEGTPPLPGVARARARLEPEQVLRGRRERRGRRVHRRLQVALREGNARAKGPQHIHISARARARRAARSLASRGRAPPRLREERAEPPRRRAARVLRERVRALLRGERVDERHVDRRARGRARHRGRDERLRERESVAEAEARAAEERDEVRRDAVAEPRRDEGLAEEDGEHDEPDHLEAPDGRGGERSARGAAASASDSSARGARPESRARARAPRS